MFYFFAGVIFSIAVIYILLNTYFKKFIDTIYEGKLIIADLEELYEKIVLASDDMVKTADQESKTDDFFCGNLKTSQENQPREYIRGIDQYKRNVFPSTEVDLSETLKEIDVDYEKIKISNNDKNKKVVQLLLEGKSEKEVAKVLEIELDQIELIKKIFSK